MKVLNSGTFYVEKGDPISYNKEAVDWTRKNFIMSSWPEVYELNAKNPVVLKFSIMSDIVGEKRTRYIEIHVVHDCEYTGLSGVVDKQTNADIWFLERDGSFLDVCPFPLFKRIK